MLDLRARQTSHQCVIIVFPSKAIAPLVLAPVSIVAEGIQALATQLDAMESVDFVQLHTSAAIVWEMIMMPPPTT